MSPEGTDPVEISTHLRPGEWDEESLSFLLESYVQRLVEMGAAPRAIVSAVDRHDDGSVSIKASWAGGTTDAESDPER
ncbi:MAG: hypothetical protein ACHP7K_01815 [Actinomycetales bacterium]|jgi:hypothetical protein